MRCEAGLIARAGVVECHPPPINYHHCPVTLFTANIFTIHPAPPGGYSLQGKQLEKIILFQHCNSLLKFLCSIIQDEKESKTEEPFSIAVIDRSGSMKGTHWAQLLQPLLQMIKMI